MTGGERTAGCRPPCTSVGLANRGKESPVTRKINRDRLCPHGAGIFSFTLLGSGLKLNLEEERAEDEPVILDAKTQMGLTLSLLRPIIDK